MIRFYLFLTFLSFSFVELHAQRFWEWQRPKPQGEMLNDVVHAGAGEIWAVGDRGTVLHSFDEGKTWLHEMYGQTDNLQDVHALDTLTAEAVGDNGTFIRTTDGGYSWNTGNTGTYQGL